MSTATTTAVSTTRAAELAVVETNLPGYTSFDAEIRWGVLICTSWQKSVSDIIETGRLLIEAKVALPHGGFEMMVRSQLPFGAQTARKLMAVARHPVLSDRAHVRALPASWGTLHQLSRLDPIELRQGIKRHIIKPEIQRKDLPDIVKRIRKTLGERVLKTLGRRVTYKKTTPAPLSPWAEVRRQLDPDVSDWLRDVAGSDRQRVVTYLLEALAKAKRDA